MSADKEFDKRLQRYNEQEDFALFDYNERHKLTDGYEIITMIDTDGTSVAWVGQVTAKGFPETIWPKHELTGRLPDEYKARVRRARCGRMTRSGKPCRNLPTCRYHRNQKQGGDGTD